MQYFNYCLRFDISTDWLYFMLSFTSEELVQYLYNESPPEKNGNIRLALEHDWNLREKYELMKHAQKRLGAAMFSPSKRSIDHILHYAEKLTKEITEEV
jgi:hypothetical protein